MLRYTVILLSARDPSLSYVKLTTYPGIGEPHLLEIVSRYLREEMMIHLILQPPTQEVHEPAVGHITRGRYLCFGGTGGGARVEWQNWGGSSRGLGGLHCIA